MFEKSPIDKEASGSCGSCQELRTSPVSGKLPGLQSEIVRYIISGLTVTLVNVLSLALLGALFGYDLKYIWNTIAIVLAIGVAFLLNRFFVFRSNGPWLPELINFAAARLLISFLFDNGSFWLFYDVLHMTGKVPIVGVPWAKVFGQLVVVVLNYLAGKFIVFRRGKSS